MDIQIGDTVRFRRIDDSAAEGQVVNVLEDDEGRMTFVIIRVTGDPYMYARHVDLVMKREDRL